MEYQSSLSQMQLLQLYELFEQSHNNLNHLFETGSTLESFAVKQETKLLDKYATEILNSFPDREMRTLELIQGCDELISMMRGYKRNENDLMIRQEKHLRKQYMKDLKEELVWFASK
jgi:hypothetical protein